MQWIKTHLTLVITIAVGVLGITGLALGMVMSDVAEQMSQDQSTFNTLASTKGSNAEAIEAARKYSAQIREVLDKGLKEFESIGSHAPILPEVLPKVNPGDASPYRFKGLYNEALDAMLAKLHAVDEPTDRDFTIEREAIKNRQDREKRAELMGRDPKATTRPSGPVARPGLSPAQPPIPRPYGLPGQPGRPNERQTPEQLAQDNERVRASIKKARSGRCYANRSTFMLPPLLISNAPPTAEEMWYAQMMLWIEQDVVNALAAVNESVAQTLPAGEAPWVGNMPVKHFQRIVVGNYVPPFTPGTPSRSSGGGGTAGGPPNDGGAVFTARGSGDRVDVVQLTLDLYVDPQYLPAVINEISKTGFYTPLLINYTAHSPTTELVGFVYGSQPVIHATLMFEGCFLRSKYEKWMPADVQTAVSAGTAAMGVGGSGATPTRGPSMDSPGGMPRGMPGGMPDRFGGGT